MPFSEFISTASLPRSAPVPGRSNVRISTGAEPPKRVRLGSLLRPGTGALRLIGAQCQRIGGVLNPTLSARVALCLIALIFLPMVQVAAGDQRADDPVIGFYGGSWKTEDGKAGRIEIQIRSLGDGQYDGFAILWRAKIQVAVLGWQSEGSDADGNLRLVSRPVEIPGPSELFPAVQGVARIKEDRLDGELNGAIGSGHFQTMRQERTSPTMDKRPPRGAVVVFSGPILDGWNPVQWKLTDSGAIELNGNDIESPVEMGSFRLHLEFLIPHMPHGRGLERGNSGVLLQGKHEIQIIDSFGVIPLTDMDCGAVVGVQAPAFNASFPPGQWQTLDIVQYQESPGLEDDASLSVELNGRRIIHQVRVGSGPELERVRQTTSERQGFLTLLDDGSPVQFRNIWAVPLHPENVP